MKKPLLSIIITSFSDQHILDIFELLDSIKKQSYTHFETIYVIESHQKLFELLKKYGIENQSVNLKPVFTTEEHGLSAARNLGIRHAKGEILSFIDDDVILFPTWAEHIVETFADSAIVSVSGPALPVWENNSMNWLPRQFYWVVSCTDWCGWNKLTDVRNAWGHNMSFTRAVFEQCGFFPQTSGFALSSGSMGYIGEDIAFSMIIRKKIGKRIVFNPEVKVRHRVPTAKSSLAAIAKRAYWVGQSRAELKKLYGQYTPVPELFSIENQLINQIIVDLLPSILQSLFKAPRETLRKSSITSVILLYALFGYFNIRLIKRF